jgi:hypothetical protein
MDHDFGGRLDRRILERDVVDYGRGEAERRAASD